METAEYIDKKWPNKATQKVHNLKGRTIDR
jgi:hypothetical protein